MRLLVILMTFLLFVGILGFVLTNLDTRVPVTVWQTRHPDLPLFLLVIVAVFAGIFYAGIIGVAEGANTRFANRKLLREVQRLETEVNYHRTQPAVGPRDEPDATRESPASSPRATDSGTGASAEPGVATAPVYANEEDDWSPDDDAYSGGRAV